MSAPSLTPNHPASRRGLARALPGGGSRQLRLLPNGDGWSLVSLDGELVYSALGTSGRRQCLTFAEAHGVIALVR